MMHGRTWACYVHTNKTLTKFFGDLPWPFNKTTKQKKTRGQKGVVLQVKRRFVSQKTTVIRVSFEAVSECSDVHSLLFLVLQSDFFSCVASLMWISALSLAKLAIITRLFCASWKRFLLPVSHFQFWFRRTEISKIFLSFFAKIHDSRMTRPTK